jgi:hypothetical protein
LRSGGKINSLRNSPEAGIDFYGIDQKTFFYSCTNIFANLLSKNIRWLKTMKFLFPNKLATLEIQNATTIPVSQFKTLVRVIMQLEEKSLFSDTYHYEIILSSIFSFCCNTFINYYIHVFILKITFFTLFIIMN